MIIGGTIDYFWFTGNGHYFLSASPISFLSDPNASERHVSIRLREGKKKSGKTIF